MLTVTLKDLREAGACFTGYNKLVRSLQGKTFTTEDWNLCSYLRYKHTEPIALEYILRSNNFDDAIWTLRAVEGSERDARLFGVWCCRQVKKFTQNKFCTKALDVAEKYANGLISYGQRYEEYESLANIADTSHNNIYWHTLAVLNACPYVAAYSASIVCREVAIDDVAVISDRPLAALKILNEQKEMFIKMCNGKAPWQEKKNA